MKNVIQIGFVLFSIVCFNQIAAAQQPYTMYESKIGKSQMLRYEQPLFFPTSDGKWLMVSPQDLNTYLISNGSELIEKTLKRPLEPTGRSEETKYTQGFLRKDGSILLIWEQPIVDHSTTKHFFAQYKDGKWTEAQMIPKQTSVEAVSSHIFFDNQDRLLVVWSQKMQERDSKSR